MTGTRKNIVNKLFLSVALAATLACATSTFAADAIDQMVSKAASQRALQQKVKTEYQQLEKQNPSSIRLSNADAAAYKQYPGKMSDMSNRSFSKVIRNTTPMTPDQIRLLRNVLDKSQRAVSQPPGTPPKPTSSTVLVHLEPGSTPPVVRLRNGYVTSVVFVDATGQPWPIAAYDLGNPKLFNIHWDQKGNTLMIQAATAYQEGNMAVLLKGLNTPVMVTLIPGQVAVDYRVDMRVPRMGPNALAVSNFNAPQAADPRLLDVLDGIPPNGSTQLQVSQVGTSAWLQGNTMFMRTRLTVLSPSWTSTVSSDDGMHAYKLQPSPIVLVMEHGKITKLQVKGF
jgi:intracellular multiplication protein IcmK